MKLRNLDNKQVEIFFHLLCWVVLLAFPHMLLEHGGGVDTAKFLRSLGAPLTLGIVFYANYLWLVPRYFMQGERRKFVIGNLLLFAATILFLNGWMEMPDMLRQERPPHVEISHMGMKGVKPHLADRPYPTPSALERVFFTIRDLLSFFLVATLSVLIIRGKRVSQAEKALQEAQLKQAEAELKNLRNSVSPHFMLNTLNNIYALISINPDQAQQSVSNLGDLLRHMLYENRKQYTQLGKEVQFLTDYVKLMKLRLSPQVELEFKTDIEGGENLPVVPMLFISLVENAFKHGVSATQPSMININITANSETREVCCDITNTNYPKQATDRSGSGVGLEVVQRRLEVTYADKHTWEHGVSEDGKYYHSRLTLKT